jgi:hypothetical protein
MMKYAADEMGEVGRWEYSCKVFKTSLCDESGWLETILIWVLWKGDDSRGCGHW